MSRSPVLKRRSRVRKALGRGAACLAIWAGSLAMLPAPAQAQGMARPDANAQLSSALIRLNRNPRDADALIVAGNAALAADDTEAAVGFFTRGLRLSPDNPRIEAGLAGAKVRAEDPFSAIPLFIAAEKAGPIAPELLGDRGLAYDLIGDNANAQQYYRQALVSGPNAEISRRLALSLAIAGNRNASETVLSGLLQKQDRAAWRARIFALAILGYEEEAVSTARSTMPPELALEIAPYLRYMRRLTPAQQAAAANLGHFPQAAEIGHDDPRVAIYARAVDRSRAASAEPSADRALIPAGQPLGSVTDGQAAADPPPGRHRRNKPQSAALATSASTATAAAPAPASPSNPPPPELLVSRDTQPAAPSLLAGALPSAPLDQPRPTFAPVRPALPAGNVATPVAGPLGNLATPVAGPLGNVATPVVQQLPRSATSAPSPSFMATATTQPVFDLPPRPRPHVEAPARHDAPAAQASFSEAFAALAPAVADITPERGAVDLRHIRPARPVPPAPPPPSHPSRIWVELGVGRDPDRIAFDWRRIAKDDPEIFRGKKPFVTSWARTNRLLVGPFETDKAANAFTEKLHRAAHASAFVWTSPAGQVVDPLDEQ